MATIFNGGRRNIKKRASAKGDFRRFFDSGAIKSGTTASSEECSAQKWHDKSSTCTIVPHAVDEEGREWGNRTIVVDTAMAGKRTK